MRAFVWAVVSILALAASSSAQPSAKHVLILYSFDAGFATDVAFGQRLRSELSKQSPDPINFFEMSLQPAPSRVAIQDGPVADYLRAAVSTQRVDMVVAISAPAARFARRHHAEIFPDTPLLISGVDERWLEQEVLTAGEVAVPVAMDPARLVQDVLRILPQTTRMFVVLGSAPLEEAWRDSLKDEFRQFQDQLTFAWFDERSLAEILKDIAVLPAHSAILFASEIVDAKGFSQSEDRVLADLRRAANAPMFGFYSHQLGAGVVGGPIVSTDEAAASTARIGVRVLAGEPAETITATSQVAHRAVYDWRELQRWGISEARLPADSIVLFRQPGIWDVYQNYIIGVVSLLVFQSALIAGLIVQRARRRRSEAALRNSYERNRDLAGRLIHAQEAERTRIARDLHDDLSQQLAGLGILLSGLKRKLLRIGADADVDQSVSALQNGTSNLAESIRNLSHELHPSVLEHAGLVATLRRHCAEVAEHHHVTVPFSADDRLDALSDDTTLCLFRVAQEALANAVRHANARTIALQLRIVDERVELSVIDDGVGFAVSERAGGGLGLRSIDERVRLLRGHARIESQPGRGAAVHVQIPLEAVRVVTGV